ncbi:MAG: hypothetical protein GWN47_11765 [Woeseiaceae bacterium]|nr:hypothetical protein [Woeseiaceae bacterium]
MRFAIVAMVLVFTACASNESEEQAFEDLLSREFSLNCAQGWHNCYTEARRICGGEFDEIDRGAGIAVVVSDTGGPETGRRPALRMDGHQQSITIRCK